MCTHWALFLFTFCTIALLSAPAQEVRMGRQGFVEYLPGTLPVIISVPHGGMMRPDGVATRTFGRLAQDSNTQEMGRLIRSELALRYGGAPHVIICRLHRMKVDCNREIVEAAQGDPVAAAAWHDFQNFIQQAREEVIKRCGYGLYIDLHGHRHAENRVELGYALTPQLLRLSPEVLNATTEIEKSSSIRGLAQRAGLTFAEILHGPKSLGALLEGAGYPSVPSPTTPAPKPLEEYFNGGYNVITHGSKEGGSIFGIQIECPFRGVRDTPESHAKFSTALCTALGEYWQTCFHTPLVANPPSPAQ